MSKLKLMVLAALGLGMAGVFSANATSTGGMERGLEIKAGGIATSHLADGSVDTDKLGAAAVTTAKIAAAAVNTAKLATDSVTNAKVLKGSIDSTKLLGSTAADTGKLLCFKPTGVIGYCSADVVTGVSCTCN